MAQMFYLELGTRIRENYEGGDIWNFPCLLDQSLLLYTLLLWLQLQFKANLKRLKLLIIDTFCLTNFNCNFSLSDLTFNSFILFFTLF